MSKGKHHWKGAAKRNDYALIFSPRMGWVRYFHFRKGMVRLVPL
jgi:hypothetical protein